jgi:hypothetical protein
MFVVVLGRERQFQFQLNFENSGFYSTFLALYILLCCCCCFTLRELCLPLVHLPPHLLASSGVTRVDGNNNKLLIYFVPSKKETSDDRQ